MSRPPKTPYSQGPGGQGPGPKKPRPARTPETRTLATIRAVGCFVVALIAAAAFLYLYWTDRSTAWLGGSLAFAMAGVGAGLVFWAHGLMPDEEVSDDRPRLTSTDEEKEVFLDSFVTGQHKIGRRRALGWLLGTALGLLALGLISSVRSLGKSPLPVLYQTVWENGMRLVTPDGEPVHSSLEMGTVLTVFPENSINATASQTVLVRVDPSQLQLPAGRGDWAPNGFLAFSKICTHAGCPVAQYEKTVNLLLCPCHQSAFDVLRGAIAVGGPASRALPQLPLSIDSQGYLVAAGDFSATPGPGFWSES